MIQTTDNLTYQKGHAHGLQNERVLVAGWKKQPWSIVRQPAIPFVRRGAPTTRIIDQEATRSNEKEEGLWTGAERSILWMSSDLQRRLRLKGRLFHDPGKGL
jgi:hypothetical protein